MQQFEANKGNQPTGHGAPRQRRITGGQRHHDHSECLPAEQRIDDLVWVMEHLDLAFRVQGEDADVVASLVPKQRPSLPWESDEEPTEPHIRNLCCRFELAWEVPGL